MMSGLLLGKAARTWFLFHAERSAANESFSPWALSSLLLPKRLSVRVELDAITMACRGSSVDLSTNTNGFLANGDWDKTTVPLSDVLHCQEVFEVAASGGDYARMASFQNRLKLIEKGHRQKFRDFNMTTEQDLVKYYQRIASLLESMLKNGYRTQGELTNEGGGKTFDGPNSLGGKRIESEIGLAINRHGQIMHLIKGQHRLAAAKVIGIRNIPAEIRLVHAHYFRKVLERSETLKDALSGLISTHSTPEGYVK